MILRDSVVLVGVVVNRQGVWLNDPLLDTFILLVPLLASVNSLYINLSYNNDVQIKYEYTVMHSCTWWICFLNHHMCFIPLYQWISLGKYMGRVAAKVEVDHCLIKRLLLWQQHEDNVTQSIILWWVCTVCIVVAMLSAAATLIAVVAPQEKNGLLVMVILIITTQQHKKKRNLLLYIKVIESSHKYEWYQQRQ